MSHTLDSLMYAQVGLGNRLRTFFGRPIPDHVAWMEMQYDALNDSLIVRWINHDGSKHHTPLYKPATNDGVNAVLVAMKLSY